MIMEEWKTKLKDGREVTLRLLVPDDKDGLVKMFSSMSDTALKWGLPPYTEKRISQWIANIENLISMIAIYEKEIIGYVAIFKYTHPRRKGVSDMGIYLHQDFHSVGLGTAMTKLVLDLAMEHGLHRISLEVVEDNNIAVSLYKKFEFKVEGRLVDAYLGADGKYHNMLVMGKILPND
jgi:putative acetyltransferase